MNYDSNRWCNLRDISQLKNSKNRSISKNNKSGVTGVRWEKDRNKWVADIRVNGVLKRLGNFRNFNDAVSVRHGAETKYGFY